MITIDWTNDVRHTDPQKYLVDPDSSNESRWLAFKGGWSLYLNQGGGSENDKVTWVGIGMFCASVLGEVAVGQRKLIYKVLLAQFLTSQQASHWTAEQKEKALALL